MCQHVLLSHQLTMKTSQALLASLCLTTMSSMAQYHVALITLTQRAHQQLRFSVMSRRLSSRKLVVKQGLTLKQRHRMTQLTSTELLAHSVAIMIAQQMMLSCRQRLRSSLLAQKSSAQTSSLMVLLRSLLCLRTQS